MIVTSGGSYPKTVTSDGSCPRIVTCVGSCSRIVTSGGCCPMIVTSGGSCTMIVTSGGSYRRIVVTHYRSWLLSQYSLSHVVTVALGYCHSSLLIVAPGYSSLLVTVAFGYSLSSVVTLARGSCGHFSWSTKMFDEAIHWHHTVARLHLCVICLLEYLLQIYPNNSI